MRGSSRRTWATGFALIACASLTLTAPFSQASTPDATGPAVHQSAAAAKSRPAITGRLSRSGYKVIALAANGRATSVQVTGRRFTLRPPATAVTLHLRAPGGRYAGPIVIRREGKHAVLGVHPGAALGKVRIRHGYATLTRSLAKRWIDPDRAARAKKGIPIGAGRIGLVGTKPPRKGGPGDRDLDGIPNALDVDDDGDLVPDGYDRPTNTRDKADLSQPARLSAFPDGTDLHLTTMLGWNPNGWVNVNGGSTDEQLTASLRSGGVLGIQWDGIDAGSGELDCGALGYCSMGGTGLWRETNQPPDPGDPRVGRPHFPACCDADGDGLGSLMPDSTVTGIGGGMFLLHGASADEIHADDVLIVKGTDNGAPVEYAASVGFVFASVPVIGAYDDGQGNKGTLAYPAAPECRETSVYGGTGPLTAKCNPPVRANADGDLVLQLKIWRPQRLRLPSEPGSTKWMDVGHLAYAISVAGRGPAYCPASTYQAVGPGLTWLNTDINGTVPVGTAFVDGSSDQPTSPANTVDVTLNVTACAKASGQTGTGLPPVQIWSYALSNTYPVSGPAADAHSQTAFLPVP